MQTKQSWIDAGPLRLRVIAGSFAPLNFVHSGGRLQISGARREEWQADTGIQETRRPHDSWFYVRRGTLDLESPGERARRVNEGECLAIPKNQAHQLRVCGPGNADLYLLHGSGEACESWWRFLETRRVTIVRCRRQEELLLALEALLRHHESPWPADRWTGGLYFQVALSLMAVDATTPEPATQDPAEHTDPAFWCHDLISREFLELRDTAQIAARLGFNADYLARRYRRRFRETPAQTLRRLKLDYACRRLREADPRLEALAGEIGFADAFSFSKAFKRHTGLSPSEWRKVSVL